MLRTACIILLFICSAACTPSRENGSPSFSEEAPLDSNSQLIIAQADEALTRDVVTVTSFTAERSAGGPNDYYSEGRYWWPNPDDPDGPYIRRDGISNPNNFSGHKDALRDFSEIVTTLTAAYELTGEEKYANRAIEHLLAWFANANTRMNPHLLYGQAIKGITEGRGIGIIDTLRLINVALSTELLEKAGLLKGQELAAVQGWFGDYGDWLTTHPHGDDERTNNNNHSTWWGAQVAAFARAANRPDLTRIAEQQFREQLPIQFATDGSQPDELGRTKPFHYINYNLRGWATYAELLSTDEQNYWTLPFETTLAPYTEGADAGAEGSEETEVEPRQLTLADAFAYAYPYVTGDQDWPYATELEPEPHPHRNDAFVFAARGLGDERYAELWDALPEDEEDLHANLLLWENLRAND